MFHKLNISQIPPIFWVSLNPSENHHENAENHPAFHGFLGKSGPPVTPFHCGASPLPIRPAPGGRPAPLEVKFAAGFSPWKNGMFSCKNRE